MVTQAEAKRELFKKLTPKEEQERTKKVEDMLKIPTSKRLTPSRPVGGGGGGGSTQGISVDESKASSQTIQIETKQTKSVVKEVVEVNKTPSFISEIRGDTVFIPGESAPIPSFSVELFKKAGREFFLIEGTPISAAGTLLSPLQGLFPKRRGEMIFSPPQRGTEIRDESLIPSSLKPQTEFQLLQEKTIINPNLTKPFQVQADIESKNIESNLKKEFEPKVEVITSDIQGKINRGEITLEEGESELLTRIKPLQEEYSQKFSMELSPKIEEIKSTQAFKIEASKSLEPIINVGKVGEFTTLGALSLTPGGQVIAGVSVASEGLSNVIQSETNIQKILGVTEIGLGLTLGGLSVKSTEKVATNLLINQLKETPTNIVGKELIKSPKGSVFKISGFKSLGSEAKVETELIFPSFQTSAKEFSITGGRGIQKAKIFSYGKGEFIESKEAFSFGARGRISEEISKVVTLDKYGITKSELTEFNSGFGRGFIEKKGGGGTLKEFQFGGVSQEVGVGEIEGFKVFGGRISQLRLEKTTPLYSGGKIFEKATGIVPIQERGFIKKSTIFLSESSEEGGINLIKPSGTKTSLEQTFKSLPPVGLTSRIQNQLIGPRAVESIGNQEVLVGRQFIKPIKELNLVQEQTIKTTQLGAPLLGTSQLTNVISKSNQKVLGGVLISPLIGERALERINSRLEIKQLQPQRLRQKIIGPFQPSFDLGFNFGGDLGGNFYPLPPVPPIGGGFFGKGRFIGRPKLGRTPSFASAVLGITAMKPGKLEFTGLVERPILRRTKKRKKR